MADDVQTNRIKTELFAINAKVIERNSFVTIGKVVRVIGMRIEAIGLSVPLNTQCEIVISDAKKVIAEAVGFSDKITYFLATESIEGIEPGAQVIPLIKSRTVPVGENYLGRVVDATGRPLDGGLPIKEFISYPLFSQPMNPLSRNKICESLDVGVRVINGLLTIGKGQRIGIFAGSGVGKSVLLGMMTRFAKSDVVIVGLIGERGREVKEFIEDILGQVGLAKAVVVAAPSDTAPLMRVNGAVYATAMAEYYRDQGKNVLLIIDSLTRYAQAHREISLATGELPATKGYAPSVFGKLSQLVERSGNGIGKQGSITAFYTVLVDGDEMNDPIADHARSILDGHFVLSRELAETMHYPAIDIEKSISRAMPAVTDTQWQQHATKFKRIYSLYLRNRDLIHAGMYQPGSDTGIDDAILKRDGFESFLTQGIDESVTLPDSVTLLTSLVS